MMDTDDFEFKPITEGLGFQKKTIEIRDDIKIESALPLKTGILPRARTEQTVTHSGATYQSTSASPSYQPIPNSNTPTTQRPAVNTQRPNTSTSKAPSWTPSLGQHQFEETSAAQNQQGELKALPTNWAAGFFDATMVLSLTMIFSTVVFALTAIQLDEFVQMLQEETGAQVATVVLVLAVLEVYSVACRSFFGRTLGEFAFDSRLGAPHQATTLMYPLQVAWRTLINALTGFVLLPFISELVGKDVLGKLSGISLYRELR
jgi:hypothetical protein